MESILPSLMQTQKSASQLRRLNTVIKSQVLVTLSGLIKNNVDLIINANKKDLEVMDFKDSKFDRLVLNEDRINNLADSLIAISKLTDPTNQLLIEKNLENGLKLSKITVPMGVIGAIYESRPNVTVDVAALCLMSGNACVLKGGKEAIHSNQILVELIHKALVQHNLPSDIVLLLPTDRKYLAELLAADKLVDLIIPRGSQSLIDYVRANSKIPTIETGAGVCHTYVDQDADINMAANIIINARVSRPSVCNSLDCAIIHSSILDQLAPKLIPDFLKYNVEVYADELAYAVFLQNNYKNLFKANPEDFGKEWLDFKITIKTVQSSEEALDHIQKYSSKHSEAIITENAELSKYFIAEVDAAAVYHNVSTRFTDGEEFGLGAEIGISTQKLHARGPFALEKLVTEKWIVTGNGQVRW